MLVPNICHTHPYVLAEDFPFWLIFFRWIGWNHQLENNDDDDHHSHNNIIMFPPQEQLRGSLKWASVRVAQSRFTGIPGGYLVVCGCGDTHRKWRFFWVWRFKRQFLHTNILHIKTDCVVNWKHDHQRCYVVFVELGKLVNCLFLSLCRLPVGSPISVHR